MATQQNRTLRSLRAGRTSLGAETSTFYPGVPLIYADAGLDFIWIDLEHTLSSLDRVGVLIQNARLAGITPLVRVPDLQPALVRQLLDNGAQGIILPQVESPDVVSELVSWCRFRPKGKRGVGAPELANDFRNVSFAEYVSGARDEVLIAIQVESLAGVQRVKEIVKVEGLDVVCLGLNDLSISLGAPGDVDDPRVVEAAERVLAAATTHGVVGGVAGFYGRPYDEPPVITWHRRGARFFQLFGDLGILSTTARRVANQSRSDLRDVEPTSL
jgi:2-keto-3-deoxy-L-rhamnonate aldolase RhmA